MTVTLNNTTGSDITYTSIAQTITANSSYTLKSTQMFVCSDPALRTDVMLGNISVGDGVATYITGAALDYLQFQTNLQLAATAFGNLYSRVTGNSTTVVKNASGFLHALIIGNNTTGGTVTLYDNNAGSGTIIMQLTIGTPSGGLLSTTGSAGPVQLTALGFRFTTGLTVVTSGSTSNDVTIIYL